MSEEKIMKEVIEHIAKCRPGLTSRPRFVGRDEEFESNRDVDAVREFLESKPQALERDFVIDSIRSRYREDPPDCEVFDCQGKKWGFELVELVDESYARALGGQRPYFKPKLYDSESLTGSLQTLLDRKARKPGDIRGTPYFKLVLLILTDEPALGFELCEEVFHSHNFRRPEPWEMAYLVFPPSTSNGGTFQFGQLNYRPIPIRFDT